MTEYADEKDQKWDELKLKWSVHISNKTKNSRKTKITITIRNINRVLNNSLI